MDMTLAPQSRRAFKPAARLALWAVSCLLLVGLSVAFVDQPVSTWSHGVLHRPALGVAVTKAAGFWLCADFALAAVAGSLMMKMLYGTLSPAWRTALAAALATLLAALAITLLKYAFGRLWPETWIHDNPSWIGGHQYGFVPFHGGEGWGSFPSGHTARITAPFAVLWQRLPAWRVLWALPPLAVAAGLIASDYHFVADCIGGAYLGIACAAAMLAVL